MILTFCKTTLLNFNVYMHLCRKNALKQKSACLTMMHYVYVLLYNAVKDMFTC
jgi:hypothetical protein